MRLRFPVVSLRLPPATICDPFRIIGQYPNREVILSGSWATIPIGITESSRGSLRSSAPPEPKKRRGGPEGVPLGGGDTIYCWYEHATNQTRYHRFGAALSQALDVLLADGDPHRARSVHRYSSTHHSIQHAEVSIRRIRITYAAWTLFSKGGCGCIPKNPRHSC